MNRKANNLPWRDLPTTSLYLQDALQAENLWIDWESCRVGPFSFQFGDRLVVLRYFSEREIDLAGGIRERGGRVIYVIDDDLEAMTVDPHLPGDYRERIGAFLSGLWREGRELIDEAAVSSRALAERYRSQGFENVTLLDPFWQLPSEKVIENAKPLEIAWLCSRSHGADLESISGDLTRFLSRNADLCLTVLCGKNRPTWMKKFRRLENLQPMPWPDYRDWIRTRRFDIALYPLLDTEVNRSRSINKFLEYAVTGAVPVISETAPFADRLRNQEDCLFAGAGNWYECLEFVAADRKRLAEMASQARNRAREIAEAARIRQVEFWRDRLPFLADRERIHTRE